MAKKTTGSLERSMEQLEEIVLKLEEDEGLSLEDTFRLYSEGMRLVGACNESIDGIEKKLVTLMREEEESGC